MSTVTLISVIVLPVFIATILIFGLIKKVDIYKSFVAGAKTGISLAFKVLPYIVAMIFAVDIFRAGGGFDGLNSLLAPVLSVVAFPPELLPLFLMRPFTGGGSMGMLAAILGGAGADSYVGRVASTFMGSSETLFYTTSLYLGSVGITKTRYIIPVALICDVVGIVAACVLVRLFFG